MQGAGHGVENQYHHILLPYHAGKDGNLLLHLRLV